MDSDGSNPRNLSRHPDTIYEHSWSPDGRQIAFYSDRTGRFEIYLMPAAGGKPRQLTNGSYDNAFPAWSPDGRRIVFSSTRDGIGRSTVWTRTGPNPDGSRPAPAGTPIRLSCRTAASYSSRPAIIARKAGSNLYVMDADGGNQRRLLVAASFDGVPVPSPDGTWIAFQRGIRDSTGGYHWDLHLVDSAGRRERRLTNERWSSQVPTWTRDGRRILHYADPGGEDHLYTLDIASGRSSLLHAGPTEDTAPSVSPDGRTVAFVSTRDGPRDLYRMDADGTGVVRLTRDLDVWSQPSWSPDGRRLLVSAAAAGAMDVYAVGADGSGLTRLTRGAEGER